MIHFPETKNEREREQARWARKFPFFDGCIGAIDGGHCHILVPLELKDAFRNRKGVTSTNVCFIVSFDGLFQYVLPGYSGAGSDQTVFQHSKVRVPVASGMYCLCCVSYLFSSSLSFHFHLSSDTQRA